MERQRECARPSPHSRLPPVLAAVFSRTQRYAEETADTHKAHICVQQIRTSRPQRHCSAQVQKYPCTGSGEAAQSLPAGITSSADEAPQQTPPARQGNYFFLCKVNLELLSRILNRTFSVDIMMLKLQQLGPLYVGAPAQTTTHCHQAAAGTGMMSACHDNTLLRDESDHNLLFSFFFSLFFSGQPAWVDARVKGNGCRLSNTLNCAIRASTAAWC